MNCKKCGSNDILTRYVKVDDLINSSSMKNTDNKYIECIEHLKKTL